MRTTDALQIIEQEFIADNPEMQRLMNEAHQQLRIAQKLYDMRAERGFTQAQLAKMIGTKASAISRLEDADYEGQSLTMLKKVADALGFELAVEFIPIEVAHPDHGKAPVRIPRDLICWPWMCLASEVRVNAGSENITAQSGETLSPVPGCGIRFLGHASAPSVEITIGGR